VRKLHATDGGERAVTDGAPIRAESAPEARPLSPPGAFGPCPPVWTLAVKP
jgi:hypothetical protein